MNKGNLIISSVLAASMLSICSAGVAYAYGGADGPGKHCDHQRGDLREACHQRMMHMKKQSELYRQQYEAIKKIRDEHDKKMQVKEDEMLKIRNAMREQARAEEYDAAKVRELADAQAKLISDMMVERMETMNRIRQLLAEQQAARMEEMKARPQ